MELVAFLDDGLFLDHIRLTILLNNHLLFDARLSLAKRAGAHAGPSVRRTARELESPRVEVAEALEQTALKELKARHPERVLATNVEFWSAVVLDIADIPPPLFPAMFACARVAGWSAHILEQRLTGRLIRPSAKYVGPGSRSLESV